MDELVLLAWLLLTSVFLVFLAIFCEKDWLVLEIEVKILLDMWSKCHYGVLDYDRKRHKRRSPRRTAFRHSDGSAAGMNCALFQSWLNTSAALPQPKGKRGLSQRAQSAPIASAQRAMRDE